MDGKTFDGQQVQTRAEEMTARQMLHERACHLRIEAARLEELANALPAKLPPMADTALRDLVINANVVSAHST